MSKILFWIPVAANLLLAGCSVSDPIAETNIAVPADWRYTASTAAVTDDVDALWWRRFGSAELDGLIQQAETANLDLQAARMRLRQANAAARIAGAALRPNLEGYVETGREGRWSGDDSDDVAGNYFTLGLSASYELDLFGFNHALQRAAQAELSASRHEMAAVRLTVTAAVASAWLQREGMRERLEIAALNLVNAEQVLKTVESRHRHGAAMPLELAQQRGVVAAGKHEVAALRQQTGDSEIALSILLGIPVESLPEATGSLRDLDWPLIDAGLPSELLLRRPDIASAEARLASASANFSAARAALWPRITLGGEVSSSSNHWSQPLDTQLYNLAGSLTAPLFNGGRLAAQRDLAEAQMLELLVEYRRSIVAALNDVDTSLNTVAGLDARLSAQSEQLQQARLAFDLAESRYRAGADSLLTLLDAQRTLYTAQDSLVRLRQARLQAAVALYKALGGGWRQS